MADTFDAPQSRNEALLQNILGAENEILPPMSNNERILQNILGIKDVEIQPIQSRIEELLLRIKNEGVLKYIKQFSGTISQPIPPDESGEVYEWVTHGSVAKVVFALRVGGVAFDFYGIPVFTDTQNTLSILIINQVYSWGTERRLIAGRLIYSGTDLQLFQSQLFLINTQTLECSDVSADIDVNAPTTMFLSYPNSPETIEINANGEYTGLFDSVNVNVPTQSASLGAKSITENGTYRAISDGFDGYDEVQVEVPSAELDRGFFTQNGTYQPSLPYRGFSEVEVSVQPSLGAKSITQNGTYNASDDNLDGFSSVTVDVPSSGASPTQFASSGTIASPDANVTSGSLLAAAWADHKYFELTFEFGGNTYVFPVQLTAGGQGNASLVGVGGGKVLMGYIEYDITNLRLALDTVFLAQMNTDGTGFVDLTSMLPTTTPATINGYYW